MAALLGPTASGKSETALLVAERAGAAIVSADSMQVYRGMDIGTAKPTLEERSRVPHHLVDLVDPQEPFTVADYQAAGREVLDRLEADGVPVLIVGGSGLHFRSLVDPLEFAAADPGVRAGVEALDDGEAVGALLAADPGAGAHVDLANPRRVARALEVFRLTGATPSVRARHPRAAAVRQYRSRVPLVAVYLDPGEAMPARVERRFDGMMTAGFLEEVAGLRPRLGLTARQAAGYRQLLPVVTGERTMEEGRRRAIDATRALAGRQRTFFGRDPRLMRLGWDDDPERRAHLVWERLAEARWIS